MLQFVLNCRDIAQGKARPKPDSEPVKATLENVTVSKDNTGGRTARSFPLPEPLGRGVSTGARPGARAGPGARSPLRARPAGAEPGP